MFPELLHHELQFRTSRSGGKGGQHVNKVESKVELRFDIRESSVLSEADKAMLFQKLSHRINSEGILVLYHQTERSQLGNKDKVIRKFDQLIKNALTPAVPRKSTRPTLASLLEKRHQKEKRAEIKRSRKKTGWE